MKTLFLIFITLFFFTKNSYAYLDPGTGSIIIQALIAVITTFCATIVFYYKKVKNFLKKTKTKIKHFIKI
jgi:uncharacterized membrane protein